MRPYRTKKYMDNLAGNKFISSCNDLAIYTGLKVRNEYSVTYQKKSTTGNLLTESDKNIDGKYRYEINCMYEIELENGEIINVYEDEINPDYKGDYTE